MDFYALFTFLHFGSGVQVGNFNKGFKGKVGLAAQEYCRKNKQTGRYNKKGFVLFSFPNFKNCQQQVDRSTALIDVSNVHKSTSKLGM